MDIRFGDCLFFYYSRIKRGRRRRRRERRTKKEGKKRGREEGRKRHRAEVISLFGMAL